MRRLGRSLLVELASNALLGVLLFTFVLFLERSGPLFEILVRNSGPASTIGWLFALVLPQVLPFTVPLGVLVGTLITLNRMSTDGEITALRAAGVPGRRVSTPILLFAAAAMMATAAASLWLTPWSIRERYRVLNQLLAAQFTADVQPRIFEEQFPNSILYVSDVVSGTTVRWRRIFLADVTPPDRRPPGAHERGDSPRITLATEAIATPDIARNRIQLSLINPTTYESGRRPEEYVKTGAPVSDQVLEAQKRGELRASRPTIEMDTIPLHRLAYRDPQAPRERLLEARIEFHQRLALPLACVLLALAGIPLGVSSRRAGKSAAVVLTVVLALAYYIGLIGMLNLARQGRIAPEIAVWTPDAALAILGIVLMIRLERPGDRDWVGAFLVFLRALGSRSAAKTGTLFEPRILRTRLPLLPQVIDTYVLSGFLFYFALLLGSFVIIFHVFTFFELLSDILKNQIPMAKVLSYLVFLSPKLIYDFTPIAVLAAVLVAFGVLTKHNEVTAFKATGVSVYRLAVPIVVAGIVLSGALFAFDHYYVPDANRRQDALRAEIKGRPPQTFLNPNQRWIYGNPGQNRIYYSIYFDQAASAMFGVSVYQIDPETFTLRRHISAEKARWEPSLRTWVFQNGWSRDFEGLRETEFVNFSGQTRTFPELDEPPEYFVKEVKQGKQMNFLELESYIRDLQQSGLDTVPLQVQFHKKFSVPLFALIMAMVSIPFAFFAGNRGAMAGVGMSFAIAIGYWSVGQVFEQMGNVSQLPAELAAWSPDAVFSLAGLYFFARMRT